MCPVSVLGNWERELARFAPALTVLVHHGPDRRGDGETFADLAAAHDVVLTTYSLVARDIAALAAVGWGRVVLDEAQQIKNPGTAQTKAVQQLRAGRRIALTGTPVENRLSELWSIMHVLNPGLLGSARSFRERFAVPIEHDHDADATELLRRATGPFILRRLKTDRSIITDLPDKIETVDHCPLTREQATLYQAVVDDLLESADEAEGMSRRGLVLAGLLRLKQVCNHPAHFLADGSPLRGRSGKLTRTEELLEEILSEGEKVLCFTQFTAWGDLLLPYLQRQFRTEGLWLHGGVRRPARDKMVQRFEDPDGPQLFLVSLKAGGTGLVVGWAIDRRCEASGRTQLVVATPRSWRCAMATMRERQREVQLYRGQIPSPGRPTVAWREDRVRFWAAIARGVKTEDAAAEAGVSSPVAFRWFRHAGGVNPCLPPTVSGRYLSFSEREDIALLRAKGLGVREIARRVKRQPVDDLAGAAPQRVDADVAARVQGVDRAVACRAASSSTEGRQARHQRAAA